MCFSPTNQWFPSRQPAHCRTMGAPMARMGMAIQQLTMANTRHRMLSTEVVDTTHLFDTRIRNFRFHTK